MTQIAAHHRAIALGVILAATAGVAGCGVTDPYETRAAPTATSATTSPTSGSSSSAPGPASDSLDPPSERDGTIPARDRAAQDGLTANAASLTARAAVLRYARLYVNWTARGLAGDQRSLASLSIGAARQQAQQAAASAATATTLRASNVADHGQVVSLQPGAGAARGRWVIVTREQTTGQGAYNGLPAQLHVTYATTTHTHRGWVISQWSPQT